MFKKCVLVAVALVCAINFAFAAVEVNKTDRAGLDGVKGVGPTLSKAILAERAKGGEFKNWADFEKRVHGIGTKNSIKLSKAGLLVNGQAKESAATAKK